MRVLDAELLGEHDLTTRDYEVMLYLAQADERKLPMSAMAETTMLTRSGITRLVDGLVECGLVERVSCPNDARVSYATLTPAGSEKLREAGRTQHRQHPAPVPRAVHVEESTGSPGCSAGFPARAAVAQLGRARARPECSVE